MGLGCEGRQRAWKRLESFLAPAAGLFSSYARTALGWPKKSPLDQAVRQGAALRLAG